MVKVALESQELRTLAGNIECVEVFNVAPENLQKLVIILRAIHQANVELQMPMPTEANVLIHPSIAFNWDDELLTFTLEGYFPLNDVDDMPAYAHYDVAFTPNTDPTAP